MEDFTTDDFISMETEITLDEQLTMLPKKNKKKKKSNEVKNKYEVQFNDTTSTYYVAMRKAKTDPITNDFFKDNDPKAFKFKYMWDPYTGVRLGEDPYGPLYFNPISLIKYFHTKRLFNLWCQPTDENGGQYEGRYDDAVGAGEDGFVVSRGYHPEWYLFRLPIPNCYLGSDHNHQMITMGPKLTLDEIKEIEEIAVEYWSSKYRIDYGAPMPSLVTMMTHYVKAISKNPLSDSERSELNGNELKAAKNKANRSAVDQLNQMRG